ncbi:hypothetical protein [Pedobacter helvus]|uniref:Lipoprotein n=1 Tax=Pedobacter helvus TaxID=2563444 RepID=A0ABW9JNP4_9SPHI|nr:hypothetical protein [Pedobacter ureilyticus]
MKYILIIPLLVLSFTGCCQNKQTKKTAMKNTTTAVTCTDGCGDSCGSEKTLSCKLTSPEMQQRKATVIASLKKQIIEKKELSNGYSYKFKGTDSIVDELADFVKTERLCCDFFDFELKVAGNASSAWLTITGPNGVKDFIKTELEF